MTCSALGKKLTNKKKNAWITELQPLSTIQKSLEHIKWLLKSL